SEWGKTGVNVTSTSGITTTHATTTEITAWLKAIDVVGADEVLSEGNDCLLKRTLAIGIVGQARDMACKLHYFHILFDILIESSINDLPLTGFETIHDRRNGAKIVSNTKENQFFVDEVVVGDIARGEVKVGAWYKVSQPVLSSISLLL